MSFIGGLFSGNTLANPVRPLYDDYNPNPTPPSAPTIPPSVPVLVSKTSTQIIVSFNVNGVDGSPTPTFSALFGPPGTLFQPLAATLQPDGTYHSTATNLLPGVNYIFQSVATNSSGSVRSVSSAVIQTNNNGAAPSQPPTIPILQSSTATSISVVFDSSGITGTAPLSYSILYGSSQTPTTQAAAFLQSGTTYIATVTGLTTGNTYFFESVVSNSIGSQTSAVSLGYTPSGTGVVPPSQAASVPAVSVTPTSSSITVTFDIAGVNATPATVNSILYGTTTTPTISAPATLVSGTVYQAVVSGLTASTPYYFKSVVANSGGTQTSAVSASISTAAAGTAPSGAPTVPAVSGSPTSTSITVTFDAAGITGTAPITYSILYGTTTTPTAPFPATLVTGTTYQAVVSGLVPATTYYFESVASNSIGSVASAVSAGIATAAAGGSPPSAAPTVPAIISGNTTSSNISVTFDVAGITGTAPITYAVLVGTTNTPTTPVTATLVSGTTYQANCSGLTAATPYYFKSRSSNVDGTVLSAAAGPFSTSAAATAPSAPAAPVVSGTPTTNSITVTFDTAGQTGTAPITYSILYGTTNNPTISAAAVLQSGTVYSAVVGNLVANTPYYFKSVATNALASTPSAVSAAISTAAAAVAPSAPSVPANSGTPTSSSITVRFDAAGQTGTAPITYGLLYGTTNNPTTSWPVTLVSGTVYEGVVTGLTASTAYYFKSVATNSVASTPSAVSQSISTASGGTPPSQAPTVPINPLPRGSTFSQLQVNVNGITSSSPVSYSALYGTASPPTTTVQLYPVVNNNVSPLPTLYASTFISNLTPSTSYNVQSIATNSTGSKSSAIGQISTTTPTAATPPALTFGSITVSNDVSGAINFSFNYSGTKDPSTFIGIIYGYAAAQLNTVTAGTYTTTSCSGKATNIPPGSTIYIAPVAYTFDNIQIGTPGPPFTLAGGVAPSGTISIPVASAPPTSNSITVVFDVSQVTGTLPFNYTVFYGTTTSPTSPAAATRSGNTVTAIVTGLTAGTAYYFVGQVSNSNGNLQSTVSAAISTAGGAGSGLKTYAVTTFLVAGPVYNTPYSQCVNYYLGCDAVGGTLNSNGQVSGKQLFGSWYANTYGTVPPSYGFASFSGKCLSDIDQSDTGLSSYLYLHPLQTAGAKVLASLGGYFMDIRGLWGNSSYQVPNFPGGTMPTVTQFTNSILNVYFGQSTPKLSSWSNSGWGGFVFDGLNIDFENIGQGGNPNVSNTYPPVPTTAPTFPANATDPQYSSYMTDIVTMLTTIYAAAPSMILTHAPLSLSINASSLGLQGGKNVAPTTNLNTWFAFQTSAAPPNATNFNSAASIALNHPNQMSYFDDIFVQFYNESPDNYLGGVNFANLLAQWAYCALLAQALGRKKTKINIGLAKGVIQGSTANPSVANSQGPTSGISPVTAPYTYWYPQYKTASPPNPSATQPTTPAGFNYPNIGIAQDDNNLVLALNEANVKLRASGLPNAFAINISDWCSGAGFWAGGPATAACKSIFPNVPNLPQSVTYAWSDAQYPAPDPQWANNVPIQL